MWVWTKNRSFFLRKYVSFIGISEIQRWGLLHYSYKKSQGDLPDHPKNWPVRLHVPSLFCHKNVDLGIFMHFFVILPKMPPTSRLLMGNPLDGFIGRKINILECASLFLLCIYLIRQSTQIADIQSGQKINALVSANGGDEKNLHPGGRKCFFNRFSGDIHFSSLVSFAFLCPCFFVFLFGLFVYWN